MSAGEGWRGKISEGLAGSALLALGAIAYSSLALWDPGIGIQRQSSGAEGTFFEPTAQSPQLILGVAAWFVWRRLGRLGALAAGGGRALLGAGFLFPALLVFLWAHYIAAPDLLVPSLQLLLLGSAGLLAGGAGLRVVRLPVAFLCLAMPIPAPLLNQIIFPLQLWTAQVIAVVVSGVGHSPLVLGDHVATPWATFQVIETCSGLRLVQTMMMASLVYGELFDLSVKRSVFLFVISPALGLLVNIGRVLFIVFGPVGADFSEHTIQGVIMVVVGVLLLAAVDAALDRVWGRALVGRSEAARLSPVLSAPRGRALIAYVAVLAAASLWMPGWGAEPEDSLLHRVPRRLGGWTGNMVKLDTEFLGSVGFSNRVYKAYERGGERVELLVGEDDRLNRFQSLVSPKLVYPGKAAQLLERMPVGLPGGGAFMTLFQSPEGLSLVLHWQEGVDPLGAELLYTLFGLDRGPWRRDGVARVWRLSTPVDGSIEEATARLLEVASTLLDFWAEVEPPAIRNPSTGEHGTVRDTRLGNRPRVLAGPSPWGDCREFGCPGTRR
jgi:exosortase